MAGKIISQPSRSSSHWIIWLFKRVNHSPPAMKCSRLQQCFSCHPGLQWSHAVKYPKSKTFYGLTYSILSLLVFFSEDSPVPSDTPWWRCSPCSRGRRPQVTYWVWRFSELWRCPARGETGRASIRIRKIKRVSRH